MSSPQRDTKGSSVPNVAILAFGRRGYGYGAANLALSIREHGDANIHLFIEGAVLKHLPEFHRSLFTTIEVLEQENFWTSGKLDPGKCKCRLYDLLPEGEWLYIDADTLCLKSIDPLWKELSGDGRPFICEVIDDYTPWASPESIRSKIGQDGASVYGVQTSWMFIRKEPSEEHLCGHVRDMHEASLWHRNELDHLWGRSMPDELLYSTACAKLGYNPTGPRATFYGKDRGHPREEIQANFTFLSLYGNGRGRTLVKPEYVQMYDPILSPMYAAKGEAHMFKSHLVTKDKYLG